MIARHQLGRETLGDIGIGAGIVAIDQRHFHAGRQILLMRLHIEIDALVHLVPRLRVGSRHRRNHADLDLGLRGGNADAGERRAEQREDET
jgi:hypothetical protein